jgi:hypothetical protein
MSFEKNLQARGITSVDLNELVIQAALAKAARVNREGMSEQIFFLKSEGLRDSQLLAGAVARRDAREEAAASVAQEERRPSGVVEAMAHSWERSTILPSLRTLYQRVAGYDPEEK